MPNAPEANIDEDNLSKSGNLTGERNKVERDDETKIG